ncbi:MAG: hypothetical protein ACE5JG_00315 [Planctomycetota bacterium]
MKRAKASGGARRVGLDQPCRICGQQVYFGYRGPVSGICGRCTDQLRTHFRGRRSRPAGGGPEGPRRRRWASALLFATGAVCGGSALYAYLFFL